MKDFDLIRASLLPTLIRVGNVGNLYVAAFMVMKLLPAYEMIHRALRAGILRNGMTVVETSSGTFALGLAIVCNKMGLHLVIVTDPAVDDALKARLEDLKAVVDIVPVPLNSSSVQTARMDRLQYWLDRLGDTAWRPNQYDNSDNGAAYARFAEMLVRELPQINTIVGPVGSGGSMCGTVRNVRLIHPDVRAIGVDTQGSAIFGLKPRPRLLRGLGNTLMPKNVRHEVFDEVHWIPAGVAFRATRLLHRTENLFAGPTTGAAFWVAKAYATQHPKETVVVIGPDSGHRYATTVYNDQWLRANAACIEPSEMPTQPLMVDHPRDVDSRWASFMWNRRTYEDAIGHSFEAGEE